jgi:dienelactone hydrolase/DNA-directed RNA polymerase subunit RPC12/RpoP
MARATYFCPKCGTQIGLSRPLARGKTIQCPECNTRFAVPSTGRAAEVESEDYSSEEGRSNLVLWLWLSAGLGLVLLLVVCGGIGMFLWFGFRENSLTEQRTAATLQAGNNPFQARGNVGNVVAALEPTTFPPQTEDYAEARKHFQTKLLEEKPSPQPWEGVERPAGVTELEFMSGELRLKAWVSSPGGVGAEKKPAVLYLYNGFAFSEDDWDETKPFRDEGYVVMMPLPRGQNGLPGSFSLLYNEVDDALAATEALSKLPDVDSERLYLAGSGTGGTLALLTAMTSSRFRAAGSFSGPPDLVRWTKTWPSLLQFNPVPFDPNDEKELQMRSPLAFPGSFKCPVRLYFGSEQSQLKADCQKLAELAKEKNLDVAAVEVPADPQGSFEPAIKQCIQFFRQH